MLFRRRVAHRPVALERGPGQELIGLEEGLPQLAHLGRREVEAAVRADRLAGDRAPTVWTGLRVGEAHGLTVA
jgi:hypothetical protein